MTKDEYGKVEYALGGLGFIINTILGFGIPASYAFFVLKKGDLKSKTGYSLYILFLSIYFLLIQVLFPLVPRHIYLSLVISFILANQVYYSYVFKAEGKGIYATLMDSGVYIVILLVILGSTIVGSKIDLDSFFAPMLTYSAAFVVKGIYDNRKLILTKALLQLKKIVSYSLHLLIGAFGIILLLNSGRFILEFYSDKFEEIGIFGFYLRISGISLVIFQMLFILYFKEMYVRSIKYLDKIFSFFLIFMLLYSITSLYVLPLILDRFSQFFGETFSSNRTLFSTLTFFTFFWTGYNLVSNIVVREGLAKNYNSYLLVIVALFTIALILVPGINVKIFSMIQLIIGALVVFTQQILLFRKGYFLSRTTYTLILGVVLTSIFVLIY
ncbi:hypothetical protein [Flagellimonas sp.]|uniref:hypothetical protein n=1 Tax=Flagellimonas sp. TaxID=2058762 RepID=UPI003BAF373F